MNRWARQLGKLSQACKLPGESRASFSRIKELHAPFDELGRRRARPAGNLPQEADPGEPPEIAARIVFSLAPPAFRQIRVANAMMTLGPAISPPEAADAGQRGAGRHHDLAPLKKRPKALEAKVADAGLILTEAHVIGLEKAKREKKTHGPSFGGPSSRANARAPAAQRIE